MHKDPQKVIATAKVAPSAPVVVCEERSKLVKLMGYPSRIGDDDYENEDIVPDWNAVRAHLNENLDVARSEASTSETTSEGEVWYPIDDALWIQEEPVPADIVTRLLRISPDSLSALTFKIAKENEWTEEGVLYLLTAADVGSKVTSERTELVQLMGFPPYNTENDYDHEEVTPNWDAVRKRLKTHPEEAKVAEEGTYPLADALWIESDPVPVDIVEKLMTLCPESLTDEAFVFASRNDSLCTSVIRVMFEFDRDREVEKSFVNLTMCEEE